MTTYNELQRFLPPYGGKLSESVKRWGTITAVAAVGGVVAYYLLDCALSSDGASVRRVADILESEANGLALDCLTNAAGSQMAGPSDAADSGDAPSGEAPAASRGPATALRGVAELDLSPVKLAGHRRVKKRCGGKYVSCVVAEVKCKFGLPTDNPANRLAVTRFANQAMVGHGLRPTHIRKFIPIVVEAAFVPDEYQVFAQTFARSNYARIQKAKAFYGPIRRALVLAAQRLRLPRLQAALSYQTGRPPPLD